MSRAPLRELLAALGMRRARIGDVVDQPAERVDFEHRLALRARQYPHRGVERAARGAARRAGGLRFRLGFRAVASFIGWRSADGAGRADQAIEQSLGGAERADRRDPELAEADIFAQRVAVPQQSDEMPRQRDDGGNLERKPPVLDLPRQVAAVFQHGAGALGKAMQAGEQLRASSAARAAPRRSSPRPPAHRAGYRPGRACGSPSRSPADD